MKEVLLLALFAFLFVSLIPLALAQTQSHPISQVTPIDTDLNMNSKNISSLNYLLYSGGIFYSGSQGIPTADIAASAVTGAKISSGVVTSAKLSNPLGGSVNGSAYYDSDNSNYYLDPASTGTSLNTAGDIAAAGDINTSRYIYGTETFSSMIIQPAHQSYLVVAGSTGATVATFGAGEGSSIATYMPAGITFPFTIYSSTDTSNPIFRVLSTGRVGIGTGVFNSGIESVLEIDGAADITQFRILDNDGSPTIATVNITRVNNVASASQAPQKALVLLSDQSSNYPLHIQDDTGIGLFTVSGKGNVNISGCSGGCGDSGVNLTLINLESSAGYTRLMAYEDSSGFTLSGNVYPTPGSTSTSGIADYTGRGGTIIRGVSAASTNSYIDFGISEATANPQTLTSVMRLTGTGRVGVGTTNPQQELEVVGDLNVTGTIYGALNTTGDVNCTECVNTADIAASAVTSAKIANGAVTSSDLSNPLGGSVNGSAYYDSDGSAYYLDPASTGTSFSSAGSIILNNNKFLYGKNSVSSDSLLIGRNSSDTLQVGDRAFTNPLVITTGNNFMVFETNGAERMRIEADGDVGIGLVSPSARLHARSSNSGSGLETTAYFQKTNSELNGVQILSGDGLSDLRATLSNGNNAQSMSFTAYDGAANREIMRLVGSTGRVGINETSPDYLLHVSGVSPRTFVEGLRNGDNVAYTMQALASDGTARGGGYYLQPGTTDATTYLGLSADNSNYHMVITREGNVAIGNTSTSAKLRVDGAYTTFVESAHQHAVTFYPNNGGINRIYSDYWSGSSAVPLSLGVYPTTDILTLASGNAGIGSGTRSPTHKLVVNQSTAAGNALRVASGGFDLFDVTGSVAISTYPATGTSVQLKAYNSGGSQRVAFNVTNPGSGEPNVILLPDGGGVAVGTNNAAASTALTLVGTREMKIGSSGYILNDESSDLYFRSNSDTARVVFTDGGNVGIGTTNPSSWLGVSSLSGTNVQINHSSAQARLAISSPSAAELHLIDLGASANDRAWRILSDGGSLYFTQSSDDYSTGVDALTIQSDGDVGIGTTGPNRKLDVVDGSIQLRHQNGIFWWNSNVDNAAMAFINYSAPGGIGGNLIFGTNGGEDMRIDSNGLVGINKTNPSTALDVSGTITGTTKNFEIDHPTKEGYRLVHSTLEGPEVGVFYRGTGYLVNGSAQIILPEYFDALTRDNTTTVILTAKGSTPFTMSYDSFDEKSFVVYGSMSSGEFDWEVKAVRSDVPPLVVEKPTQ